MRRRGSRPDKTARQRREAARPGTTRGWVLLVAAVAVVLATGLIALSIFSVSSQTSPKEGAGNVPQAAQRSPEGWRKGPAQAPITIIEWGDFQ